MLGAAGASVLDLVGTRRRHDSGAVLEGRLEARECLALDDGTPSRDVRAPGATLEGRSATPGAGVVVVVLVPDRESVERLERVEPAERRHESRLCVLLDRLGRVDHLDDWLAPLSVSVGA